MKEKVPDVLNALTVNARILREVVVIGVIDGDTDALWVATSEMFPSDFRAVLIETLRRVVPPAPSGVDL